MSRIIRRVLVFLLIVLLAAAGVEVFAADSGPNPDKPRLVVLHRLSTPERQERFAAAAAVLERRLKNHTLPDKARRKLSRMNDEELRIVTALCGRLSAAGEGPGADVALLLVTALIILS